MHITGMAIANFPPFTETVAFEFDERVNVFIGPNASGKSTVLLLMRLLRHSGSQYYLRFPMPPGVAAITVSDDWPRVSKVSHGVIPVWDKLPYVEIAAIRGGLPRAEPDYLNALYSPPIPVIPDEGTVASILEPRDAMSNFNGASVEKVINLLIEGSASEVDESVLNCLSTAIEVSYSCAKRICSEIIQGDGAENLLLRFGSLREANDGMAVRTIDDNLHESSRLPLHYLSSGIQTSLLWVRFLALKMLHHYEFADGWEKQPAILLIDEIENHLHPTWQRRVIPALLEHFPGLQIFATTHSPFVVAGLKAGQVHMLKRDENGVVTASTNERDIIGWTTDEILRTFMGVDEPTDQLTIDRYQRLRELRGKESLTDEEAAEMEDLRRRVNADFLSSVSPLGRERERLGDMMLDFLRSRQSELSQDGDQR